MKAITRSVMTTLFSSVVITLRVMKAITRSVMTTLFSAYWGASTVTAITTGAVRSPPFTNSIFLIFSVRLGWTAR